LGCTKERVETMGQRGGAYGLAVKGNPEKRLDAMPEAFEQALAADQGTRVQNHERGPGRDATRRCPVRDVPQEFPERAYGAGLRSWALVSREYGANGSRGICRETTPRNMG
jgi:hypothetical protein